MNWLGSEQYGLDNINKEMHQMTFFFWSFNHYLSLYIYHLIKQKLKIADLTCLAN